MEKKVSDQSFYQTALSVIFVCIMMIAAAYRIYRLDDLSLWPDELWGVLACSKGSWWVMMEGLIQHDSHPPGYQTLLYWWMLWFGQSDFVIRLPSALAGIASVFAVYRAGKYIFNREAGLIAAMMLAGSYADVYYSQEARAYSILVLFLIVNLEYFFRIFVVGSANIHNRIIFWVSLTAIIYLHYVGSVWMLSEAIVAMVLVLRKPSKIKILSLIADFSIPFVLYLPWLPTMYRHATTINYWAEKPTLDSMIDISRFVIANGSRLFYYFQIIILVFWMATCIFFSAIKNKNNYQRDSFICLILAAIPFSILLVKSYFTQSIFTVRHFIFLVPFVALLCGAGISWVINCIFYPVVKIFFVSFFLVSIFAMQISNNVEYKLFGNTDKHDIRGAVRLLLKDEGFLRSSRVVVTSHDFFDHYLNYYDVARSSISYAEPVLYGDTKKAIANSRERYFYYMEISIPESNMISPMLKDYRKICQYELNAVRVVKFSTSNQPSAEDFCPSGLP